MNKRGIVSKVEDGKLQVILTRSSACGDCSSCGGCEAETINLNASNDIDAKVGDFVEIEYNTKNMLKSTVLLYIFPLAMLLVGIILGQYSDFGVSGDSKDLLGFALGLALMFVSYFIINRIDKKIKTNHFFKMKKIENIF
ncbi:MAG: SoxR reducing system RseC family protein [Tissierellia bacterium]|nr:SoxR reducing system RseC family protein [Tissierellia bacterium]